MQAASFLESLSHHPQVNFSLRLTPLMIIISVVECVELACYHWMHTTKHASSETTILPLYQFELSIILNSDSTCNFGALWLGSPHNPIHSPGTNPWRTSCVWYIHVFKLCHIVAAFHLFHNKSLKTSVYMYFYTYYMHTMHMVMLLHVICYE